MTDQAALRHTRSTAGVYDRVARFYDVINAPMEALGGRKRRSRLLARARGRTLEVGIGTGRNLGLYAPVVELAGIDISPKMLERARAHAATLGRPVMLEVGDAEQLPFATDSFDTVAATCVFCSVDDPIQGLREMRRVVRPDGRVLLLEHVRPRGRLLGWLADRLTPLTRRFMGPEINRRTEEHVQAAGLVIEEVRREGVWREIVARKG